MDQNSFRPSLGRIIWTDYTAFLSVIWPIAVWVVYIAWVPDWWGRKSLVSPWISPYLLYLAVAITLVGLGLLVWRVYLIWSMFRHGQEVAGRIASVVINRDRGRVEYTYTYKRKRYKTVAAVHRNKQTKALKSGEAVVLMVDQKNPERAFIRNIYL
jgi:hypothetical protein